jgi:DNA repair protein RecO
MYHIYRTKAIVIAEKSIKDDDKYLFLLTKDFGLIRASALGIRKNLSKLKFALQVFSIADISLVRGKSGYRITNAQIEKNVFYVDNSKDFIKSLSQVFNLLQRLIQGEEFNPEIYNHTESVIYYFIKEFKSFYIQKAQDLEIILVSKILYELGYFDKTQQIKAFIEEKINENHFKYLEKEANRKKLVSEINKAIKNSHL